ncbi:unnamed protein product [Zymoseptoria tritici ST99CH_3D1]|nr:unnamed protein product [Zymoseptoria tritici ST99CH_3D1]
MTDTSGNLIQAHGGNIIRSADSSDSNWYWFGEDKSTGGTFQGVNCYSSPDLTTWTAQGHVLSPISGSNISSSNIVERPKVIYNDKNKEYVMWFHGDTSNYGAAWTGVATSKTVNGPYTWKGNFNPLGQQSRDMTIYKDPSTSIAYLIFATNGNADFEIASLDEDYYNVVKSEYTFKGVFQEAPGVFLIDGTYYLLFSPQDGWTPTDNGYHTAPSMSGPWSATTLLSPKGTYAYLTQNAYDITIKGTQATTYLYLGDHWNAAQLGSSTYAFYPVTYDPSKKSLSLHYTSGWTLDLESGTVADLPFDTISATDSTTPKEQLVDCASTDCPGGKAAKLTPSATKFTFTWPTTGAAGKKVVYIQYTYNGPKNAFKHARARVDGVEVTGWAALETTRGSGFSQRAPLTMEVKGGSEVELEVLDLGSGEEVLVEGVLVYEDTR